MSVAFAVKASGREASAQVSICVPTPKGPLGAGKSLKGRVVRTTVEQPRLMNTMDIRNAAFMGLHSEIWTSMVKVKLYAVRESVLVPFEKSDLV